MSIVSISQRPEEDDSAEVSALIQEAISNLIRVASLLEVSIHSQAK